MKKIAAYLSAGLLAIVCIFTLTACIGEADEGHDSATSSPQPATAAAPAGQKEKILIAYFTLGQNAESYPDGVDADTSASRVPDNGEPVGTTEYVARLIQANVGGDLHSIKTVAPYPGDFNTVIVQNHEEMNAGTLPELVADDLDMSGYDVVFIGYPVWATNAPQAIFSFLARHDLTGKTVITFCTHDGYGAGSSYGDIAAAIPGATFLDGLAIEAKDVPGSADRVTSWLKSIGIEAQQSSAAQEQGTPITITVGNNILEGVLYDTELAKEISAIFPLTVPMRGFGGREYYGGVDFYPEHLAGGRTTFENGHITYCEAHHNMAVFYAQTDNPNLSVEVMPIGKVTSDLSIFESLPANVEITFDFAK